MNTISRKSLISLASASLLMLSAAITQAATRYVPSQYATIQASINAAATGDTIVVAAGTYHETLVWENKNLILQGAGQNLSIIDPRTANGGLGGTCLSTESLTSASRIDGFTFQYGNAVTNGGYGGGMYNYFSNLWVTRCTFYGNTASWDGGGMYNSFYSSPHVTNCIFTLNTASYRGGGMENFAGCSPTLTNCVFAQNHLSTVGPTAMYGGGVYNVGTSKPVLNNCTFYANSAPVGGGMFSASDSPATVTNCIFWGNTVFYGLMAPGIPGIYGPATLHNTDDQDLAYATPDANGNFGANPLFVNAAGGNLSLLSTSPCHNRGTNTVVVSPPYLSAGSIIIDLDDNPRVKATTVDLGAYEIQQ